MRKALMAEQKKNEMQTNIQQLRTAYDELESEVKRLDEETPKTPDASFSAGTAADVNSVHKVDANKSY